jgi:hypothetical protein
MPQIAKRPFMAAVMRAVWRFVKRFDASLRGRSHDPAATSPGKVLKPANFSPVN